jgi:uncharacterized protein YhbP (UPF0306 family)
MSSEPSAVDVPGHVIDFLAQQSTLTLATASPTGVPRASTFLYVNDGPNLYFWSKPHTMTARHIEQNSLVSFAVDDYTSDLGQTRGVQGTGECRVILSGEEIARIADLFGQKFPDLSPGATMSISFFRISPADLEFIDNTDAGARAEQGQFGAEFHRQRAYSVFDALPREEVEGIRATLQVIEVGPGEVVVRQGGPADKFFIVADGELELAREQDGRTEKIGTLERGDFFGELSILRDTPRESTVTATTAATLFALDRDTFRDVVAQSLGTTPLFDQLIEERLGG